MKTLFDRDGVVSVKSRAYDAVRDIFKGIPNFWREHRMKSMRG